MLYILTEDSSSGNEIWKLMFSAFNIQNYIDLGYEINKNQGGIALLHETLCGITQDQGKYTSAISKKIIKLQSCDTLLVVFDGLGAKHFRDDISAYCIKLQQYCNVYICEYKSLEWFIIRHKDLWDWVNQNNTKYYTLMNFILRLKPDCLESLGLWNAEIDSCNEYVKQIYYEIAKAEINRLESMAVLTKEQQLRLAKLKNGSTPCNTIEDAISEILKYITDESGFWFVKSIIGPCWKVNCCNQRLWNIEVGKICLNGGQVKKGITKHIKQRCNNVEPADWKVRLQLLAKDSDVGKCVHDMQGNHYTIYELLELL